MWTKGEFYVPAAADPNREIKCTYCVKHYEEPSIFGIDEGRISKLQIKICDMEVCSYDRGWDVRPTCKEAEFALEELMEVYN